MLNQLWRYAPLIKMLRDEAGSLAEIGSGPHGISQYLRRPVINLDVHFFEPPGPYAVPVVATAAAVPLADASIDTVLVMDTLEHIPTPVRRAVIEEAMRVTRRRVIFGGPMDEDARRADERLAAYYGSRGLAIPAWLAEHLRERAPDVDDVMAVLRGHGWRTDVRGNENLYAHVALLRLEARPLGYRGVGKIRQKAPGVAAAIARALHAPPYYSFLVSGFRPDSASSQADITRSTSGSQS